VNAVPGATAFIPSDCNRVVCRRRNAYRKNTDTTENASTLRQVDRPALVGVAVDPAQLVQDALGPQVLRAVGRGDVVAQRPWDRASAPTSAMIWTSPRGVVHRTSPEDQGQHEVSRAGRRPHEPDDVLRAHSSRLRRSSPDRRKGKAVMAENIVGLVVACVLLGYLVLALIFPEKF